MLPLRPIKRLQYFMSGIHVIPLTLQISQLCSILNTNGASDQSDGSSLRYPVNKLSLWPIKRLQYAMSYLQDFLMAKQMCQICGVLNTRWPYDQSNGSNMWCLVYKLTLWPTNGSITWCPIYNILSLHDDTVYLIIYVHYCLFNVVIWSCI